MNSYVTVTPPVTTKVMYRCKYLYIRVPYRYYYCLLVYNYSYIVYINIISLSVLYISKSRKCENFEHFS